MVEQVPYKDEVKGSSPLLSTIFPDRLIGKSSVFGTEVLRSSRGWGASFGHVAQMDRASSF